MVTCIDYAQHQNILIVGSKDCRISMWKVNEIDGTVFERPINVIYGHYNEIQTVIGQSMMNLLFSIDNDGVFMIHSLPSGRYIRSAEVDVLKVE